MTDYFVLFLNNLLPIFLAALAGYLLARWLPINPHTLSSVTFYIFTPCLVFNQLVNNQLSNDAIIRFISFAALCISLVGILTFLTGKLLKFPRGTLSAVIITSMFMNAGNFGLPVTSFAFGKAALAYATLFFVTNSVMTNTVGVVIASMGKASLKTALGNVIKIPTIYALALAIIFIQTSWKIPLPVTRTVEILGGAAVPCLMVLLGIQFHSIRLKGKIIPLAVTSVMRLLVSPALAFGLSSLLALTGPARQAGILEAAMPAAVLNTVLATQFETEPAFVSAAVVVTTLLSIFTLTPLLAILGG